MEIIGRVLKSLVTSFLVSGILFVVVFSVVTNEFPPKISRIKAGVENMQKLMLLTQQTLGAQMEKQIRTADGVKNQVESLDLSNDDTMIENMNKLGKKRMTLGQKIFGGMGDDIESGPVQSSSPGDIQAQMLAMRMEMAELKSLLKQVKHQQTEIKDVLESRAHGANSQVVK